MADLGRISGQMLKSNLERLGVDLAFENDLIYLDVSNGKVGIKTDVVPRELTNSGTLHTTNLIVDSGLFTLGDFQLNGSTGVISNNGIPLNINSASNIVNFNESFSTNRIIFKNNFIGDVVSNEALVLNPNGTGIVDLQADVDVTGDLHAVGNVTLDGQITFGDNPSDTVTISSEIDSNILPDVSDTYSLGSQTNQWKEVHSRLINGILLQTTDFSVPSVDNIARRPGNTWYVSAINGSDSYPGNHQLGPFRTIKYALSQAQSGDTVYIYDGEYEETFPLTVPQGVSIHGEGIRSVKIYPHTATNDKDAFLLNGETTITDLTVADFYYNSTNNTGYAFRFANNYNSGTRSPYIQNVSVITNSSLSTPRQITPGPGPTLTNYTSDSVNVDKSFYSQALVDSLVGQVAVIDRYPNPPLFYNIVSIETESFNSNLWRITFDTPFDTSGYLKPISFYSNVDPTLIIANDIWDTSGSSIGEKWVAYFKSNLPANFETTVQPGWTINVAGTLYVVDYVIEDPVNTNQWRIYVTTSLVGGTGIPIFSSPLIGSSGLAGRGALIDGSVVQQSSQEASMLFHSATFITPGNIGLYMTNGVRVEWLNSFTYFASKGLYATNGSVGRAMPDGSTIKFGAELRSIGSANVYGSVGAEADGNSTLMYLINHNFAYIGSGLNSDNDPTLVDQEFEVVEANSGKIYYTSVDQEGDFRAGDAFIVDQQTGFVTINGLGQGPTGINQIVFSNGDNTTTVNPFLVSSGNVLIQNNEINTVGGDLNFSPSSYQTNLNDDVDIFGSLAVGGDVTVNGIITFGDSSASGGQFTVSFDAPINIDLEPKINKRYNIGSDQFSWKEFYTTASTLDNIRIFNNRITTTESSSNLELRANSTGNIVFNQSIVNNNFTASDALLNGLDIQGNLNVTGPVDVTGDIAVDGNVSISGTFDLSSSLINIDNIVFDGNKITTTSSNSDLELQANGTGRIYIPNQELNLGQALQVSTLETNNVTNTGSVTSDVFRTSSLTITNNTITSDTNVDLELRAPSGDIVYVPNNNVVFDQALTVNGISNLKDVSLTGLLTQTGNYIQAGTRSVTGTYTLNGNTDVNSAQFDNIKFDGNVVTTTQTNSDLELRASGTGVVNIQPSVTINNNISVGVLDFGSLTATNTVTSAEFYTDQILIKDNFITTVNSNADLELRAPTGRIISFNDGVIVDNNFTVSSNTSLLDLNVNNINQIGDRTQSGNVLLTGELAVSENLTTNDILETSEINFDTNFISTTTSNTDLEFRANGTGKVLLPNNDVVFGLDLTVPGTITANDITIANVLTFDRISDTEIIIDDNFIKTSTSNANLEFSASGTGLVLVNDSLQITGTLFSDSFNAPDVTASRLDVTTTVHIGDRTQTGNLNHPGDNTFVFDVPTNSSGPYSYAWIDNFNALFGADRYLKKITYDGIQVYSGNFGSGYGSWTAGTIVTGTDGFQYEIGTLQGTGGSTFGITEPDASNPDTYYSVKRLVTLSIDVTGNGVFPDVTIAGNSIQGSTDLVLQANGTGRVVFDTNDLVFKRNLEVIGNVDITGDITVNRLVFNSINNGTILIDDNFISTTISNSNLDLGANGTGIVNIPSNDVDIQTDLTVLGSSDLQGLSLTNLNHTGNRSLTGDYTLTGLFEADNFSTHIVYLDNIEINNNTIKTTVSNSNLDLRAVGTGIIEFKKQTIVVGDLSTLGDITARSVLGNNSVVSDTFTTGDIVITDSSISTTQSNSDLNFVDSTSQYVRIENVRLGRNLLPDVRIDTSTTPSNLILAPAGNLVIEGTDALLLPVGTTAQDTNTVEGKLRYNTTTQRFEGRNAAGIKPLGGIYSTNTQTRVLANDNNTISFFVAGTQLASITETAVNLSALKVSDIFVDNNVVSSINNSDINIVPDGTGDVILSDIIPRLSEFENTGTAPFTIACTASGYVKFNSSTAVVIPNGTTAERHVAPEIGEIRFNIEAGVPEVYDGTQWNTWAGQSQTATEQEIDDLSTIYGILLG